MANVIGAVRPIQRTTLTTAAFEQLISHVVNGTWKAGHRIPPERELCQQLGIARTSLREALKAMELVGMLDSRVGDGTFVCPRTEFLSRPLLWAFTGIDHAELQDIMEARTIVEESLARLAAERASEEQVAEIGMAVQSMRDCIAREESILEADMAFHIAVSRAAQNAVLTNAVQLLRNLMRQSLQYKLTLPNIHDEVLRSHASIYAAIQNRKPGAAALAMKRHLEKTMHYVTHVMQLRRVKTKVRKAKAS